MDRRTSGRSQHKDLQYPESPLVAVLRPSLRIHISQCHWMLAVAPGNLLHLKALLWLHLQCLVAESCPTSLAAGFALLVDAGSATRLRKGRHSSSQPQCGQQYGLPHEPPPRHPGLPAPAQPPWASLGHCIETLVQLQDHENRRKHVPKWDSPSYSNHHQETYCGLIQTIL